MTHSTPSSGPTITPRRCCSSTTITLPRASCASTHGTPCSTAAPVRTEHEFFAELCDGLDNAAQVLVTGSHTALADFRHYVEKHRPATAARIVAYDPVDHPTDHQLVALARKYFVEHDRMTGNPDADLSAGAVSVPVGATRAGPPARR